jgi:hypothetical protein
VQSRVVRLYQCSPRTACRAGDTLETEPPRLDAQAWIEHVAE